MRTELDTPNDQRFLMVSSILTDSFIKELDVRLIPDSIKKFEKAGENFKDSTSRYFERDRCGNQVWCFTLYAYADIPIGKKYDMIFEVESKLRIETQVILKYAILCLGGFFPVDELGHGHKHICVFEFPDGIPHLISSIPKVDISESFNLDWPVGIAESDSWNSISKSIGK